VQEERVVSVHAVTFHPKVKHETDDRASHGTNDASHASRTAGTSETGFPRPETPWWGR
jgi:hypothetical protein